jgi:hypothetical protein
LYLDAALRAKYLTVETDAFTSLLSNPYAGFVGENSNPPKAHFQRVDRDLITRANVKSQCDIPCASAYGALRTLPFSVPQWLADLKYVSVNAKAQFLILIKEVPG